MVSVTLGRERFSEDCGASAVVELKSMPFSGRNVFRSAGSPNLPRGQKDLSKWDERLDGERIDSR